MKKGNRVAANAIVVANEAHQLAFTLGQIAQQFISYGSCLPREWNEARELLQHLMLACFGINSFPKIEDTKLIIDADGVSERTKLLQALAHDLLWLWATEFHGSSVHMKDAGLRGHQLQELSESLASWCEMISPWLRSDSPVQGLGLVIEKEHRSVQRVGYRAVCEFPPVLMTCFETIYNKNITIHSCSDEALRRSLSHLIEDIDYLEQNTIEQYITSLRRELSRIGVSIVKKRDIGYQIIDARASNAPPAPKQKKTKAKKRSKTRPNRKKPRK